MQSIIWYYTYMDLTILDLEIFLAVSELGSATAAAKRLAMTQPGVSQHIANLEKVLQKGLFTRVKNRIELNDFGRAFVTEAKKFIADAQRLEKMGTGVVAPTGILRLGVTDSATQTVIPGSVKEFREKFADVHIKLDVEDSVGIETGVLRGHFDLGVITAGHRQHIQIESTNLYEDRIDALVSNDHKLAKKKSITLEELCGWPLLLYPRVSRTRRFIDEIFHARRVVPKETIDVYNNTVAVMLAELGIGVALLSEAFINSELLKHKCSQIRIKGNPFVRNVCLVRRKDHQLNQSAQAFYDILIMRKKM